MDQESSLPAFTTRKETSYLLHPRLEQLGYRSVSFDGVSVILPPIVEIPTGPFLMGSQRYDSLARRDERPQSLVMVAAFAIGMFPVTVAEFDCAVQAGALSYVPVSGWTSQWRDSWDEQLHQPDSPVSPVPWLNAMEYAIWLARLTGQRWRLPTEAEWEKAARGTDGRQYPWGNTWENHCVNTSAMLQPIGAFMQAGDASPYGCHDLVGHAPEWCSSLYLRYPYQQAKSEHPVLTNLEKRDGQGRLLILRNIHVTRGCWCPATPSTARVARREATVSRDPGGGFRLVTSS